MNRGPREFDAGPFRASTIHIVGSGVRQVTAANLAGMAFLQSGNALAAKYYDELYRELKIRVGRGVVLLFLFFFFFFLVVVSGGGFVVINDTKTEGMAGAIPQPRAWPEQFHSVLVINNTKTEELQVVDLWYDWPNGRNLNLIQHQLGKLLYDVEWNNGTSYYYTLDDTRECRSIHFEVGILRPNWLDGAIYLGRRHIDGFLCNVWQKVDFIWYYEDVLTKRPVHWLFYSGMAVHVMTFEVGAVLEDCRWQAPVYCFDKKQQDQTVTHTRALAGFGHSVLRPSLPLCSI